MATTAYSNETVNITLPEAPTFTTASLTKTIVFGVMFVVSFIGNLATLVQMKRLRNWKSTFKTLIINLAIADLLVAFFCIAADAAWAATVQWLAGDVMCKFVKYMQVFPLYLSTYITVAISLDRCVAILDPMRRNSAAHRVRVMICFAWIFSALFSIPQHLNQFYNPVIIRDEVRFKLFSNKNRHIRIRHRDCGADFQRRAAGLPYLLPADVGDLAYKTSWRRGKLSVTLDTVLSDPDDGGDETLKEEGIIPIRCTSM